MKTLAMLFLIVASGWLLTTGTMAYYELVRMARGRSESRGLWFWRWLRGRNKS